ncbi:hypothetical protein ACSYDW_12495 [Paeniglutamicibacter sp. R2-26]|uniref:hypothetical protein n=1 Tax=Paeniglutamicibacter sp. R2-26 TaxID=3144417 RepID=UPI003EE5DC91
MKRILGSITGCLALTLAVAGCVPLESQPPAATQEPLAQSPTPTAVPTKDPPEVEPYSAKGLQQRIAKLSKGAVSREIQDGRHPIAEAIPGTERTVLANMAAGEHNMELPEHLGGDNVLFSLGCLPGSTSDGPIVATFSDPDPGWEASSSIPGCVAGSYFSFSSGFKPGSQPTSLTISAPAGKNYEYSVVTFTGAPEPSGSG